MAQSLEPNAHETTLPSVERDPFQGLVRVEADVTIEGTATLHIDPHNHAISWCVQPKGSVHPSSLRVLRPEDRVTVTSAEGGVLFDGPLTGTFHLIDPVSIYRSINGLNPPPAGFPIYWSPKGIDPHTWLSFFEGANTVTVHRHSTALVPPEFAATTAESLKTVAV